MGTVGQFESLLFQPYSHLDNFDIGFDETSPSEHTKSDFSVSSRKGVRFTWKAAGETTEGFQGLAKADAGVKISFDSDFGYVFAVGDYKIRRVSDKFKLQKDILVRMSDDVRNSTITSPTDWVRNYAVITDLVEADSVTVIISETRGNEIELKFTGELGPNWMELSRLSTGVEVVSSSSGLYVAESVSNVSPLFHSMRVERGFWGVYSNKYFTELHDREGYTAPEWARQMVRKMAGVVERIRESDDPSDVDIQEVQDLFEENRSGVFTEADDAFVKALRQRIQQTGVYTLEDEKEIIQRFLEEDTGVAEEEVEELVSKFAKNDNAALEQESGQ
ncbi:hypothetical protein [Halomarina salina]|uniref:hypothetical protein n=1 Tax=Halomarina salina TaxID=1872699 RepID=UPI001FF7DD93|nr:hypothetical protein [Halomarina salina]